ncbi:MAG: hypothetical protein IIA88_10900 [Bacteroidetes bacterium]|nr:hypothetical protein [Bacteroidota bacterium]
MKKLKLYFLFIIPWILIFSCDKEDDKIEPVEIPFHSRVEIDYSGIVIQDGESITIDGVTYSHKLNLADPTSVLDSGFLMTTYSSDSVNAVIDTIKWQNGNTVKYVFKRKPDLTIVSSGDYIEMDNAINANNNGIFIILSVDTASGSIEVTNTERTNSTEDESNSTAIATIQDPELITSQVVDIITGDTITITVGTIFTDKKTILIDKINYHAPGGSLLLQLYRNNRDSTIVPPDTNYTYIVDKYILKVKGGIEIINLEDVIDLRAKTIQIESKTGSEITISPVNIAKITYY